MEHTMIKKNIFYLLLLLPTVFFISCQVNTLSSSPEEDGYEDIANIGGYTDDEGHPMYRNISRGTRIDRPLSLPGFTETDFDTVQSFKYRDRYFVNNRRTGMVVRKNNLVYFYVVESPHVVRVTLKLTRVKGVLQIAPYDKRWMNIDYNSGAGENVSRYVNMNFPSAGGEYGIGSILLLTDPNDPVKNTYTWCLEKTTSVCNKLVIPHIDNYSISKSFSSQYPTEKYLTPSLTPLNTSRFSYKWEDDSNLEIVFLNKQITAFQAYKLLGMGAVSVWADAMINVLNELKNSGMEPSLQKRFTLLYRTRPVLQSIPEKIEDENRINFRYWKYIERFVTFGGSAGEGQVFAPDPQWIDEAHRNGVPIFGTVFIGTPVQGGTVKQCQVLSKSFSKLISIADSLNFEGWFLNVETFDQSCLNSFKAAFTGLSHNLRKKFIFYSNHTSVVAEFQKLGVHAIGDENIINMVASVFPIRGGFNPVSLEGISTQPYVMFMDELFWRDRDAAKPWLVNPDKHNEAEKIYERVFLGDEATRKSTWKGFGYYTKIRVKNN